jgi:hypothetical protein
MEAVAAEWAWAWPPPAETNLFTIWLFLVICYCVGLPAILIWQLWVIFKRGGFD